MRAKNIKEIMEEQRVCWLDRDRALWEKALDIWYDQIRPRVRHDDVEELIDEIEDFLDEILKAIPVTTNVQEYGILLTTFRRWKTFLMREFSIVYKDDILESETAWQKRSKEIEKLLEKEKCVHTEHCCIGCGCKYGDEDCPVWLGYKPQSYTCGECDYNPKTNMVEKKEIDKRRLEFMSNRSY